MESRDARTIQMVGTAGLERLRASRLLVVGVGGVGSYAAEALARSGIGFITVMDGDEVAPSNLNRQLVALNSTIGANKAQVMAERLRDINPAAEITALPEFYGRDNGTDDLDLTQFDWIADCIDDVDAKVRLITTAVNQGVNIISAMGAAGKFETVFKTADISKTSTCPLARVMRKRLRNEGIDHLPVVFSEEKPIPRDGELGSISYVPGSLGLELAGYIIKQIAVTEG